MRKTLNENPVVQLAIVGLLAVAVAFLLVTRVLGGGGSEEPAGSESAPGVSVATGESGAQFDTQLAPEEGAEALGAASAAIDAGDAAAAFDAIAGAAANGELVPGGVDVSRVPALVVVRPRERSRSGIPVASVSYGFRGPASAEQAVRDALYDGRQDLPYHPK